MDRKGVKWIALLTILAFFLTSFGFLIYDIFNVG